jgi:glyoxylase-like metal-dependent hydrolase (beta-lactamase superfamily II)
MDMVYLMIGWVRNAPRIRVGLSDQRIWILLIAVLGANALPSRGTAAPRDWCNEAPAPELKSLATVDVQDTWFVVHRVRKGLYAITEPRQAEQVISYLILGTRRALLFDSGLGIGKISRVVRRLTGLPITVLNSHTHFDHVGGNAEFEDIRNEDIAFSRASARGEMSEPLAEYARPTLDADHVCGSLPPGLEQKSYEMRSWHVSRPVRDGEEFNIGGRRLTVIFTPGHTPDSMCLLDRRNGLLFTGDTFYLGPIYLWAPGTDLNAYAHSVDILAELVPHLHLLLPAHGLPVADPDRLLELKAAVAQLQAGALAPVPTKEGRRLYRFEHFSLLLAHE